MTPDEYIDRNLDRFLEETAQLCRQPSISARNEGIAETAELVAAVLRGHGCTAQVLPTPNNGYPVVYAEAEGRRNDRTLLFYNHYDVQPPEPLELWETPPFDPSIRDGKLFARGAADDKGHIVSRLAALDAVRASQGALPCRVKFIIEGEEEIGSVNLAAFVRQQRALLAADACIWESGGVNYQGQPVLYLGMRGICYLELFVKVMDYDAHSGFGGSLLPNAAWRLVWALASLKGPDERIRVPGFYDAVREPTAYDLELLAQLPDDEEEIKRNYGVREFLKGLTGLDLKRERVFSPTCTICGLTAGYQGPGSKTVQPCQASAKVDFRLVPEQDPHDIAQKVRRHLVEQGFGDVHVTEYGLEHPARVDPRHPFVQLAAEAAVDVYGRRALLSPITGGSGPMYPFVHDLGLPVATPGISYPGTRAHAPNEHFRIDDFVKGTKYTARIIERFAAT